MARYNHLNFRAKRPTEIEVVISYAEDVEIEKKRPRESYVVMSRIDPMRSDDRHLRRSALQ